MLLVKKHDLIAFLTQKIAEAVEMDIDQINPDGNLEDLGLSSMDAVMISGEIEERFNIEIEPMIMFENKTIHAVAEKIMLIESE